MRRTPLVSVIGALGAGALLALVPAHGVNADEDSTAYSASCSSVTVDLVRDGSGSRLQTAGSISCLYWKTNGFSLPSVETRFVEMMTDRLSDPEVEALCSPNQGLSVRTHFTVTRSSGSVSDEAHDIATFRRAGGVLGFVFESDKNGHTWAAGSFSSGGTCGVGNSWTGALELLDPRVPELPFELPVDLPVGLPA